MSAEERALLKGPAFRPWDRFWMLDRLCEEVPPDRAAEVLPLMTSTAMVVIRHVLGRVTGRGSERTHRTRAVRAHGRSSTERRQHERNGVRSMNGLNVPQSRRRVPLDLDLPTRQAVFALAAAVRRVRALEHESLAGKSVVAISDHGRKLRFARADRDLTRATLESLLEDT